jgi:hypothetical protein
MHAFGRTLRQAGDLRLLALPVGSGRERYCVAEGPTPVATFPTRGQAQVFFETVRAAREEGERQRGAASGGVTDLTAYRRRRARGGARGEAAAGSEGHPPARPAAGPR